jgi:nanoRNase/pAp phosphatase (c-di-AMP/oligoRNAs hydrolase)
LYRDVAISYLGMIKSEAIVPELADVLLRVEGVHWSLCMGQTGDLMIISLRSTARKLAAGRVMRRLVHGYGAAGGHREMAGGQVPIQGLTGTEVEDLAQKLIEKFLGLINRQTVHPRPLV